MTENTSTFVNLLIQLIEMNSPKFYLYAEYKLKDSVFYDDIGIIAYEIYKVDDHYVIKRYVNLDVGFNYMDEENIGEDEIIDTVKKIDKFLPFDVKIETFANENNIG